MSQKRPVTVVALNGGEISPRLFSRIDFAMFQNAARKMWNWIPIKQGGAVMRAGTRFIGLARPLYLDPVTGQNRGGGLVKLFTFNMPDNVSDVIVEVGEFSIRFWTGDDLIYDAATAEPYEIYPEPVNTGPQYSDYQSEIDNLRFAQKGNTFVITSPLQAPWVFEANYRINSGTPADWKVTYQQVTPDQVPQRKFRDEASPATVGQVFDLQFSVGWSAGETYGIAVDGIRTVNSRINPNP